VSALLKNILNNKKEGPVQLGKKPQSALQQMEVQLQNERAQWRFLKMPESCWTSERVTTPWLSTNDTDQLALNLLSVEGQFCSSQEHLSIQPWITPRKDSIPECGDCNCITHVSTSKGSQQALQRCGDRVCQQEAGWHCDNFQVLEVWCSAVECLVGGINAFSRKEATVGLSLLRFTGAVGLDWVPIIERFCSKIFDERSPIRGASWLTHSTPSFVQNATTVSRFSGVAGTVMHSGQRGHIVDGDHDNTPLTTCSTILLSQ